MPVFGTAVPGVRSRCGNREITDASNPSITDVNRWLDEAEAELLGAIRQGGGSDNYPPGSGGFLQIRKAVERYVAGQLRQSHAAVAGDGDNDDGEPYIEEWKQLLHKLRTNAQNILAGLEPSGNEPYRAVRMGSHVTDLDLTPDEYEPAFRVSTKGRGLY